MQRLVAWRREAAAEALAPTLAASTRNQGTHEIISFRDAGSVNPSRNVGTVPANRVVHGARLPDSGNCCKRFVNMGLRRSLKVLPFPGRSRCLPGWCGSSPVRAKC